LTHRGQLILRKISKFDATRCQILRLKCTKFDFRCDQTPLGELTALPGPWLYLKGSTSKERGRRWRGWKGKRREGPPQYFGLKPPLASLLPLANKVEYIDRGVPKYYNQNVSVPVEDPGSRLIHMVPLTHSSQHAKTTPRSVHPFLQG